MDGESGRSLMTSSLAVHPGCCPFECLLLVSLTEKGAFRALVVLLEVNGRVVHRRPVADTHKLAKTIVRIEVKISVIEPVAVVCAFHSALRSST